MRNYGYIENELGYVEDEMMILRLLNNKEEAVIIGTFLGELISSYELKDIRKAKSIIKKLYSDEVTLIDIFDSDNISEIKTADDIEFTREYIKLNELGKIVMKNKINMSLFNTRTYEANEKIYKNISLDKSILFEYLEDKCKLEDIRFTKESGFEYLNEKEALLKLFKEGFGYLNYNKSYDYLKYMNRLRIVEGYNKEIYLNEADLKDFIASESVNINYIYFMENELKVITLENLLIEMKNSYNSLSKKDKKLYKEGILKNYKPLDYETNIDINNYYLYYDKENKSLGLSKEFMSDNICFEVNLNKYDYYIIIDSLHIKIDLSDINLHKDVLGLFRVEKELLTEKYIYFLNEDGEIKSTSNIELQMRNKQIRSLSTDRRLLKVYEVLESEKEKYGILLITEKGYIKILNLLEYKIKNRCSKYVMGINLEEDDKVIFSNLVSLDEDILKINIDGKVLDFNIESLISSKVNKGKRVKIDNERIEKIKMESE